MKKMLFALVVVAGLIGAVSADPTGNGFSPQELNDYLFGLQYDVVHLSSVPVKGANLTGVLTFDGHATDIQLYFLGGNDCSVTLSTSNVAGGSVKNLSNGEEWQSQFAVVRSSPTYLRYTLQEGCTLHATLGGLKK